MLTDWPEVQKAAIKSLKQLSDTKANFDLIGVELQAKLQNSEPIEKQIAGKVIRELESYHLMIPEMKSYYLGKAKRSFWKSVEAGSGVEANRDGKQLSSLAKEKMSDAKMGRSELRSTLDLSITSLNAATWVKFIKLGGDSIQLTHAVSLQSLVHNLKTNQAFDASLFRLILKCILEKIPIFYRDNSLCFFANGLQTIEVTPDIASIIYSRAKHFPQELLLALSLYYRKGDVVAQSEEEAEYYQIQASHFKT